VGARDIEQALETARRATQLLGFIRGAKRALDIVTTHHGRASPAYTAIFDLLLAADENMAEHEPKLPLGRLMPFVTSFDLHGPPDP
jgi:hypothetical protein